MLDTFQPALGRIHLRYRTALGWAAILAAAAAVLPVAVEDAGTVWPWDAAESALDALALAAPFLLAVAWATLARRNLSSLTSALLALAALGFAGNLGHFHHEAWSALLFGLPGAMRRYGLLLLASLATSGAAVLWRMGPRQGARAVRPARVLALVSLATTGLLFVLPRGLLGDLQALASLSPVNAVLALVAPGIACFQAVRALRATSPRSPHLGFSLAGAPAVVLMWGAKAAAMAGRDALFGLALRSALLFAAALVVLVFALDAALAQLFDAHVPEELARGGLWRDRVLLTDGQSAAFRPFFRHLVRERRESLWLSCAGQGARSRLDERIRLRLAGVPDEELRRLDDDAVSTRLAGVDDRSEPRLLFLAKGRRIELAFGIALISWASAAAVTTRVHSDFPAWSPAPEPTWARALFAEHLPAIALARLSENADDAIDRAAARARLEAPDPALSEALSQLAEATKHPPRLPRAAERPGRVLTEAARRAGLPYVVETDVLHYADRNDRPFEVFVARVYAVRRARIVDTPAGPVSSLWLERIDGTNAPEPADMRPGDREARVRIDVARARWRGRIVPRLRLGPNDGGADRLGGAIAGALGSRWNQARFEDTLHCTEKLRRVAMLGFEELPQRCDEQEAALEHDALELLLPSMESHAVRHVLAERGLDTPAPLDRALILADENARRDSAVELSAALAEIAEAPVPELALEEFARAGGSPAHPAWNAYFAAAPYLAEAKGDYRARARAAWQQLFGSPLSAVVAHRE